MPVLALPLGREEYRRKALNHESFLVATDSLKPHPALKELRVPMPQDAYERLFESIQRYGIRVPLSIWTPPGQVQTWILDGATRWAIAGELGFEHVPVQPLDLQDELEARIWIVRANLDRRQLTPGQRAMLAKTLYELEKERARERMRQAPGQPRGVKAGAGASPVESFPQEKSSQGERKVERMVAVGGRAREIAAVQAGISGRTLEKAMKAVEARPELAEKLKRGEISVDQAYRIAKGKAKPERPKAEAEAKAKAEAEAKAEFGAKAGSGRVPTVGPQVVVTLSRHHFEGLCELAQKWGFKPKELASHGLTEWLAAQDPDEEEPQVCVRLPLERYKALEGLCRPADEPVSYLARFILCSVALHPEKYPELLAPVRPAE